MVLYQQFLTYGGYGGYGGIGRHAGLWLRFGVQSRVRVQVSLVAPNLYHRRGVVQLGLERVFRVHEVAGSNPVAPTITSLLVRSHAYALCGWESAS